LLLLSLRLRGSLPAAPASSAATTAPITAWRALALRLGLLLLRLLRTLLLLLPLLLWLALLAAGLLIAACPIPIAIAPRSRSSGAALVFAALFPHLLLEFLDFASHELPALGLLSGAQLVMTAVGAALPSLGIGLLTGRAEDTFRQRHRNRRALYTSGPMTTEERRRATLLTLIELAEGSSPQDCWDDARAEELLRSQSNPEELRELGMSEQMIHRIFPEQK